MSLTKPIRIQRIKEQMDKRLYMTIAADLFMLELIAKDNEKATNLRLPKVLLPLYREICESVAAKVNYLLDKSNNDFFQLSFSNPKEQDKVWTTLYDFNHSEERTYPLFNVYDQLTGKVLHQKITEFTSSAIQELKNPSLEYLFQFYFIDDHLQFDGPTLNQNLKSVIGSGVDYVMAWDNVVNQPIGIMIRGQRDLALLENGFKKEFYKLIHSDWQSRFDFWGEDHPIIHTDVHIKLSSKFGFENDDFWQFTASKMSPI